MNRPPARLSKPILNVVCLYETGRIPRRGLPGRSNQANKCDWSLYKGKFGARNVRCTEYVGEIPGVDLELDNSQECEVGYFRTARLQLMVLSYALADQQQLRASSFAPNYALKDAARQTVDLRNSAKFPGNIQKRPVLPLRWGKRSRALFYEGCEQEECECRYNDVGTEELTLVTEGYLM